jgi:uncharacterized protein YciI
MSHYILFYEFVPDIVERRAPHRDAHLARVREQRDAGRILMAGALGDPPHGGVLVFEADDPAVVEEFARADPYVANGLVTSWRVEPWAVVPDSLPQR